MAKKDYAPNDDDFEFGELKTGKEIAELENEDLKDDDTKNKVDQEIKDDIKEDLKKETDDKGKGEDIKLDDKTDKSNDSKLQDGEEKVDEEITDEDVDIFLDEKLVTEEGKKISLKNLAKDLDVDLEKDDDEQEFKTKVFEKLEKNKLEFKLDGYTDDAKAVIRHLNNNGGNVASFFTNPQIASMQGVLAMDPETKVRSVRIQEVMATGVDKAKAIETVDEEIKSWGTREIKDLAGDIDEQARELINTEVKKIVGDQEIKSKAEQVKREATEVANRLNLKSFIEKQDNFLGLGLTPEAKKLILRDIDNGNFDKVMTQNPEQIKFSSYMFSKYGSKIMKKIESSLSEQNRIGHNAATRKALDALHKVDNGTGTAKKSGHQTSGSDANTGTKPKWTDDDFS